MRNIYYVRHGQRWTSTFASDTDGKISTTNKWLDSNGGIRGIWLSNLEYDNKISIAFRKLLDGQNSVKDFHVSKDFKVVYEHIGAVLKQDYGTANVWDNDVKSIGGTLIGSNRKVEIGFAEDFFTTAYCWDSREREAHNSTLFALKGDNNILEITLGGNLTIIGNVDTDFIDAQYSIVKILGNNNLVKIKMHGTDSIKFSRVSRYGYFDLTPMSQDRVKKRIISFNEHLSRGGWKTSYLDYVVSVGNNNRLEVEYY